MAYAREFKAKKKEEEYMCNVHETSKSSGIE